MRGRVMALYGVVFLGTTPIASPVAGWVGEHLNARVGLAGGGVMAVATGLVGLWLLARRETAAPIPVEASSAAEPPVAGEALSA
jgi:hypothetical protein